MSAGALCGVWGWLMTAAGILAAGPAVAQERARDHYDVSVWADVLFGEDGAIRQFTFVDEAEYPPAFIDQLRERLARARIRPVLDDGRPASFQTGVRLRTRVQLNEQGGAVTLRSLAVEPLVLKRYAASYPNDIGATPGWNGQVTAVCTVEVEGRCNAVRVVAVPGMPESVRRFAVVSMAGWAFKPQEVNGVRVTGESQVTFDLTTPDYFAEDFRVPKFERLERIR